MAIFQTIVQALGLVWNIVQYFIGNAEQKAAAAQAMAAQFSEMEKAGYPVLLDILKAQGRTSWIQWSDVPVVSQPPSGAQTPPAN